jgi:O-antigen ligase
VFLLFLTFLALLAGRFTLDRLSPDLPAIDLRLGFLYIIGLGIAVWLAGAHRRLSAPRRVAGAGFFVAWVIWLIASSAWAPDGARIGPMIFDLALLLLFTVLAWSLMGRLPYESTANIWKWMLLAGVIYFVLALAAGPGAQGRYAAPGGGPNVFVRIMVLASIAALYFSTTRKSTWFLLPVPLFAVGAALSGSRGGLLSAGVILLIFSVPIARMLGAKRVFGLLLIVIAGSVWLIQRNEKFVEFLKVRYLQQTLVEGYSSGRDTITEDALRLYQSNPIVGVGADGYWALQSSPEMFEYPHNLFIATLAEAGMVGVALLVICLLVSLSMILQVRPMTASVLFAAGAGIYQCIASLFSGDYYDTRLMWFFLGFAAIEAARTRDPAGSRATGVRLSPVQEEVKSPWPP